jgi:hypothetical protein
MFDLDDAKVLTGHKLVLPGPTKGIFFGSKAADAAIEHWRSSVVVVVNDDCEHLVVTPFFRAPLQRGVFGMNTERPAARAGKSVFTF